jgi:ATP adenylyltransferase
MIAPYAHIGELTSAPKPATDEMMDLVKACQRILRDAYNPEGFNVGMNLGRVAGAGIADHIHMHILPRWGGDTNFMSTVGDTRVLPEALSTTYEKLRGKI